MSPFWRLEHCGSS